MSENTTIKDKKVDKQFFIGVIHTVLAFIINIILGCYVIYVSKILQFIKLPTDINKYPYTTSNSIPEISNTPDQFVGINYLYTESLEESNKSTIGTTRELLFTKIHVNPNDYKQIYDAPYFFSELYNAKNSVTYTFILLVIQYIYSFYYWGICYFFQMINFSNDKNTDKSNSLYLYLWETFIMLIGFPAFIIYSIVLTGLSVLYIAYIIIINLSVIWNYDFIKNKLNLTDDKYFHTGTLDKLWRGLSAIIIMLCLFGFSIWCILLYAILIPFLLPFFIYIFACLIRIYSITNNDATNENNDDFTTSTTGVIKSITVWLNVINDKNTGLNYGLNFLSFFSVILAIMSYGSIIPAIIYIIYFIIVDTITLKNKKYSITTILLSKIEPISYIIAIIIIAYSTYYGSMVSYIVGFLLVLLCIISKKHQLLFYPYIPENDKIFVKAPIIANNIEIKNTEPIKCSEKSTSISDIFKNLVSKQTNTT